MLNLHSSDSDAAPKTVLTDLLAVLEVRRPDPSLDDRAQPVFDDVDTRIRQERRSG